METDGPETYSRGSKPHSPSRSSIIGSVFGDNNKIHLGDLNYHFPSDSYHASAPFQENEAFLSDVSAIDPQNQRSWIRSFNPAWDARAFSDFLGEDEELGRWLTDDAGQLLWVRNDSGSRHPLLAAKMLDAFEFNASFRGPVVSHFFCAAGRTTPLPTVTDVLAGLVHGLLTNSRYGELVLPLIRRSFSRRVKNIRDEASGFAVREDMFLEIVRHIRRIKQTQQLVVVISDPECCVTDAHGSGILNLMDFVQSTSRTFSNTKWIIISQKSPSNTWELQTAGIGLKTLLLSPTSAAAALGLTGFLNQVTEVGRKLRLMYQDLDPNRVSDDQVSSFRHCSGTIFWMKPHQPGSKQESRLLWYRQSFASPTTVASSPLGVHVASGQFSMEERYSLKIYFSFASLLLPGSTRLSETEREPQNLLAKALWAIVAQLLLSICGSESSMAAFVLSLSHKSLQDLVQVFGSTIHAKTTAPWSPPTLYYPEGGGRKGVPEVMDDRTLLEMMQPLSSNHLSLLQMIMKSILHQAHHNSKKSAILVLDNVHLIQSSDFQQLVDLLQEVGHSLRVLLCVSASPEAFTSGKEDWGSIPNAWVHESTEYKECLQGLRFNSMHQRQHQIVDALAHTNQWLWANEAYMKWRDDGGLLWISGKAGSGKSVLANTILQTLRQTPKERLDLNPWSICAWFYSARGVTGGTQHDSMLRTLIFDIIGDNLAAFHAMKDLYRDLVRQCDGLVITWPLGVLQNALLLLSSSDSMPNTVAVIDAFDESERDNAPQSTRANITAMFRRLVSLSSGRMRIVFLSRPDADIAKGFRNFHHISVQDNNRRDIVKIVDDGIFKIRSAWSKIMDSPDWDMYDDDEHPTTPGAAADHIILPAEVEAEIDDMKKYLISKASGVTLWVVLVLQDLQIRLQSQDCFTISDLRATLEALPVDLEELYLHFRLMQEAQMSKDPNRPSYSKQMLTWIVGSQRWAPLQLGELWEAIAILGPNHVPWSDDKTVDTVSRGCIASNKIQFGRSWERFYHLVHQHCGLLVEIHRVQDPSATAQARGRVAGLGASADWTIQLAHETVRKFFRTPEKSGHLSVDIEAAELIVATTSYSYLGVARSAQIAAPDPKWGAQVKMDVLALIMSSVSRVLGFDPQLLAHTELLRTRPLTLFALQVIRRTSTEGSFLRVLKECDDGPLAAQDRFITHWVADLCFAPVTPETGIRDFVRYCCSNGRGDFFAYISGLTEKHSQHSYDKSHGRAHRLRDDRRYEIVGGAIETLAMVPAEHWICFRFVAEIMLEEVVRITGSTMSFGQMDLRYADSLGPFCITQGLELLSDMRSPRAERGFLLHGSHCPGPCRLVRLAVDSKESL
ncbi:hypothetical protein CTA2_5393 [Colletotrichum tanaceti]|uniref:Nephrocystin 3-like N-terminal domain-containing protein n=1 Tax=Colletotrichum tanaceti TaxID=1306861 RepID=A0A4U6X7A3_9PEZI|nr:hypothetical protein CTA2_5393 [Colletotrichum tanaceti]TKW50913.1 hypothetical protein CTA1_2615 [Colletotrichum tanaceti]